MIFLSKSILRRTSLFFVVFAVFVLGGIYFLYLTDFHEIPLEYVALAVGLLFLYFIGVFLFEYVRPLNIILKEVRALLTGKQYRRIFTRRVDEIGVLAHFFNEVTKSFEKVALDIKIGKRMRNELEIAAELQRDILPLTTPDIPGLDVIAKNRPAAELGGDNFDFITRGENTYIYIGDVTGHGVPAALVMTMVNTLVHTFADIYISAYDIVVNVNRQLKSRIKNTMFMTMIMLRWNHVTNSMTYVGAGHEHIIIFRAKTGDCEIFKSGGIALGMVADNSALIKEKEIQLNEDDAIILYTDGITEGRNMEGEMYGLERLVSAVKLYAPQYDSTGTVKKIAIDYSGFVKDHVQDDDVTLIMVKRMGKGEKKGGLNIERTSWSLEAGGDEVGGAGIGVAPGRENLPGEYKPG